MATDPQRQQPSPGGAMSVEDYVQLDQQTPEARYKYIDGVARLMSGGSVAHARIARNVANAIDNHLLSGPCTTFPSDVQVLIGIKSSGKDHYVYPDVTVSCDIDDRRRDNMLIRSPQLVIEVLSPSTEHLDRGKKLAAYKQCSTIEEIVLINQFAQIVEVYHRENEENWRYQLYGPGTTIDAFQLDSCSLWRKYIKALTLTK